MLQTRKNKKVLPGRGTYSLPLERERQDVQLYFSEAWPPWLFFSFHHQFLLHYQFFLLLLYCYLRILHYLHLFYSLMVLKKKRLHRSNVVWGLGWISMLIVYWYLATLLKSWSRLRKGNGEGELALSLSFVPIYLPFCIVRLLQCVELRQFDY